MTNLLGLSIRTAWTHCRRARGGASVRLSTVSWCSQAGATYLILVHGFGAFFGDFELDISADGAACEPKVKCPSCPADLSGDGMVEAFDLALLLGAWGPCAEPCVPGDPADTCVEDLDGDCEVEAFDLALLLGAWGQCP